MTFARTDVLCEPASIALVRAAASRARRGMQDAEVAPSIHRPRERDTRCFNIPRDSTDPVNASPILDGTGATAYIVTAGHDRESPLSLRTAHGTDVLHIGRSTVDICQTMPIHRADGRIAAVVHNPLLSPLRNRWKIDVPGEADLIATGTILLHEYAIRDSLGVLHAVISNCRQYRRDAFDVEAIAELDTALVLAVVLAIEILCYPVGGSVKRNSARNA